MRARGMSSLEMSHKGMPSIFSFAISLVVYKSSRGKDSRSPLYPGLVKKRVPPELDFHERRAALRNERGLTWDALADPVEMHISQIRRYEAANHNRQWTGCGNWCELRA